jgi:hypothetical protein
VSQLPPVAVVEVAVNAIAAPVLVNETVCALGVGSPLRYVNVRLTGLAVSDAGGAMMVRLKVCVAVAPALSVTRALKISVPAELGVPVIAPELASVSPDGSAPEIRDHV